MSTSSPWHTAWQTLTLTQFAWVDWRRNSWVARWVGALGEWERGSWLLPWGEAIAALMAALVFGFAPFVSTALMGVLMLAVTVMWGLLSVADRPRWPSDFTPQASPGPPTNSPPGVTPIHLVVAAYFCLAIVATVWSPVRGAAISGLLKLGLYLGFFAGLARVLRQAQWRSRLILVYLLAALATSVYGLQQWFGGVEALATWVDPESPLSKTTRVFSYLGNPNLLAAYLLPSLPLSAAAIFAWRGWLPKALALTMLVTNGACLVLTFSRGGWLAMVVALGVFGALLAHWQAAKLRSPHWRTWLLPTVLGGGLGVLLVAVVAVPVLRDRVASMFVGRGDSSNSFRINVWQAVLAMIHDRPFLGIGPGNEAFNKVYPLFQKPKFNALSAYSIALEIAVETGLIGLTCFIWLLFLVGYHGWQQFDRLRNWGVGLSLPETHREAYWLMAGLAIFCGMLAHGLVDTVWYRPQISSLWWFTVALITSYYQPPAKTLNAQT